MLMVVVGISMGGRYGERTMSVAIELRGVG